MLRMSETVNNEDPFRLVFDGRKYRFVSSFNAFEEQFPPKRRCAKKFQTIRLLPVFPCFFQENLAKPMENSLELSKLSICGTRKGR